MVSAAILSVALVIILNSFVISARVIHLSGDSFRASLLLEEKLFELSNTDVGEGLSAGDFDAPNNGFSWRLKVLGSEENAFREVRLRVLWKQSNREQEISVITYL